jgi:hypothetical protein
MRFDAYAATIRDQKLDYVANSLADSLEGIASRGKPMPRYGEVLSIDVGSRMAAWVGVNTDSGHIYVEGKGETTPGLAQSLRVKFPEHTAPRIDVCEDFDEPGAFDALIRIVRGSKGPRVKGGYVALPDDVEDGKTWAAGVRGGVGFVRCYEAGKHPDRVHLAKPNWARLELECRPHYARDKAAAARMSPLEVWGMSAWTRAVGEAVTHVPIPRFEAEIRQYSHDKTTRYIANTFRRHFEEMLANGEHIERTLRSVWEEQDAFDKLPRNRKR